ncbi:MAG: sensor histidine kinase [Leptospirales bacterium]|nr:sensor histidine kinase [Leptospirales bacterium]
MVRPLIGREHALKRILCILQILCVLALATCSKKDAEKPAQRAVESSSISIRTADLIAAPFVSLDGGWRLHFGEGPFSDPEFDDSAWPVANAVGHWLMQGKDYDGIAWYRLRIQIEDLTPAIPTLAVRVPFADAASEVYWNGEKIGGKGIISSEGQMIREGSELAIYPIPKDLLRRENVLAIRIRSAHGMGGISRSGLMIGNAQLMQSDFDRELAFNAMFAAVAFGMALYHIAIYAIRRKDRYNLYFLLLSLLAAMFIAGWNGIGTRIWDNFYWNLFLIQIPITSNALCIYVFIQNFLGLRNRMLRYFFLAFSGSLTVWLILGLALRGPVFTAYMRLGMPLGFVCMVLSAISLVTLAVQGLWQRIPQSAGIAAGISLLSIACTHAVILYVMSWNGPELIGPGYVAFTVSMAIAVGIRNASAHTKSEELSVSLAKKHEETLRLRNQLMEKEKMAAVGSMAAGIVHDFKNPVGVILGYAEYLKDESGISEEGREYLQTIEQEANRLSSMAQDILDYTRGSMTTESKIIDLGEFLSHAEKSLKPYFSEKGIHFEIRRKYDGQVRLDPERFLRVLINIAGNAADVLGSDGRFDVLVQKNGHLVFALQDNGPGIPESIQGTLFEPFVTHGKSHGTGLGMAITKSIVEAHGGTIRFETGQGTTFFIEIPA